MNYLEQESKQNNIFLTGVIVQLEENNAGVQKILYTIGISIDNGNGVHRVNGENTSLILIKAKKKSAKKWNNAEAKNKLRRVILGVPIPQFIWTMMKNQYCLYIHEYV